MATNSKIVKKQSMGTTKSAVKEDVTLDLEGSNIATDFTATEEPPKVEEPQMARIRLAKDHRCNIGGTAYYFEKGKVYDVPVGVKRVLKRGDLLRPLS